MENLSWEFCNCDWCGAPDGEKLFSGPDLLMDLPGEFNLVRCSQCNMIRQNPRLTWESLESYYPENYSAYERIIDRETSRIKRADRSYGMQKRVKAIERFQAGGKLLDVGCGTGVFLAEAKKDPHWEVAGIEPNPKAAEYTRNELGVEIYQQRFADAPLPNNQFDVITMWNVLEHLDFPSQDLRRAMEILRPGGWLVFSIPNLESLDARLFGHAWIGWDLPRHLYLFPGSQLKAVLERNGFSQVYRQCIAGSHAAFALSLEFWLKSINKFTPFTKSLLKVFLSMPVRLILFLPFLVIDRMRLGSIITVFAQKK